MIIQAITNNGDFAGSITFDADTAEEFIEEATSKVEFIPAKQYDNQLRDVWAELVQDGYADFGWTDFYKRS